MINKLFKITLIVVALIFLSLFAYGLYVSILGGEKTVPNNQIDGGARTERLKDPNLLYGYFSWSGMCSNDYGEEGGCVAEKYLYLDGKYMEKYFWIGLNNRQETEPIIKKQLDNAVVEKVKAEIRSQGLMAESCPPIFTTDAGWDYFINLDGIKKDFSNPPKSCWDVLKSIDKIIDSAQMFVIGIDYSIDEFQNEGKLGSYQCLSLFRSERGKEYNVEREILALDFFESFESGMFFGKISSYEPKMKKDLAPLINQLIREKKIATYEHIKADVCLYDQDLNNPPNGAGLGYYVEHEYCTNDCYTGKYKIRVELQSSGAFVGYRYDAI